MKEEFLSHYAMQSNVELLLVLYKEGQYQPAAIEAVKEIMQSREVTEEDRQNAWQVIKKERQLLQAEEERKHELRSSVRRFAGNLVATSGGDETHNLRVFCVGLTILWLYQLYAAIRLAILLFKYGFGPGSVSLVWVSDWISTIIMPIGIYLLFNKKNGGWFITTFIATKYTIGVIWAIISGLVIANSYGQSPSGFSLYTYLTILFVCSLVLYYLNSLKVIALFSISRNARIVAIVISFLLTVFIHYLTNL
jgi:hypothetical protein